MVSVFFRHEFLPAEGQLVRLPTLPRQGEMVYLDNVKYVVSEVDHIVYTNLSVCELTTVEYYQVVAHLLTVEEYKQLVTGKG